jgi:hypothetical protein
VPCEDKKEPVKGLARSVEAGHYLKKQEDVGVPLSLVKLSFGEGN